MQRARSSGIPDVHAPMALARFSRGRPRPGDLRLGPESSPRRVPSGFSGVGGGAGGQGMAVAQQHGERAWISMVALSNRWRDRGIGSALLSDLEVRLRTLGVRRISAP